MPALVAIVSLYEAGEWLENRLRNLSSSSLGHDLQIVCVNAGSPDKRDEIIPKQFPNVKYIKLPERVGVYTAWNIAIKATDSNFITNANADDLIAPTGYQILTQALRSRRSLFGFSYPSWYTTAIPNQSWASIREVDKTEPGRYLGDLNKGVVGHFPVWRRKLHDQFGLFDERFNALGDADFWARCHCGGVRFTWVKQFLACYLWRNGQNLWHQAVNDNEWKLYHEKAGEYRQGREALHHLREGHPQDTSRGTPRSRNVRGLRRP